jgi:DNA polymerase-3 subunit delta'
VRVANGNFVKAEEMISENEDNALYFTLFTQLMRNCYAYNVIDIQKWVDTVASWGREKQKFFLTYALKMIRENIVLNQVPEQKMQLNYLSDKELDFSSKFSAFITPNNVQMIADEFDKACFHIERNVFSKLVLLDLALKLMPLLRRFQ